MPEVVIRNNNVTVQVTQPGTTETVTVLQGPTGATGPAGAVQSIVAGTNITVNSADPANPVVSASGGSAAATTFTPTGNIAATNVQAAIQELDTEKSSTGHTHAASAITFTPTGAVAATTVQAAIAEVDSEKETPAGAQTKANSAVSTHAAATDPHGDRAYTDTKTAYKGARVATTVAQSVASGVAQVVTFDFERWDNGGFHDNVTNNTRLTIPTGITGFFEITGLLHMESNAGSYREIRVKKNGANDTIFNFAPATYGRLPFSCEVQAVPGDYFQLEVQHDAGVAVSVNTSTFFAIRYVGAP